MNIKLQKGSGRDEEEEETAEIAIALAEDEVAMVKKTVERCQLAMNFGNAIWLTCAASIVYSV